MEDVIMTDAVEQKPAIDPKKAAIAMEFKKSLSEIDKAVPLKDIKSLSMNFRLINKFRQEFTEDFFVSLYELYIRSFYQFPSYKADSNEFSPNALTIQPKLLAKTKDQAEILGYVFLILVIKLIDQKQLDEAFKGLEFLINYFKRNESLTIQYLKAKAYYYYSLIAERSDTIDTIIKELHSAYRKSCLDMDETSQVTLINCIVRYYLNNNAVEQARNFLSKTKYHENVSTNEDARYLFYTGRIEAVQMNYSDAYKHLSNSLRKAPEKCGQGFKNVVNKLMIIVQLLMGEIPDIKPILTQITDFHVFKPYLDLLKVVKHGNLEEFKIVLQKYEKDFERDKNFTLIQRIRHVVIKAGLRKINLSYSRISIKDITEKLRLEGEKEAEYIIAKAIRDGVFLAKINHDEGYVQSMEIKDIYSTFEPQKSYQSRIEFLNKIYNDCQQAMKYSEKEDESKKAQKNTDLEELDNLDVGLEDF